MKKSYAKLMWRGLRGSAARFFSILAIVAVGVGFLGGLLATTPDMQLTVDRYYDAYNTYDVDLKGTMGFTEEDVRAAEALGGVSQVQPARVMDVILQGEGGAFVTRIYGMDTLKGESMVNGFELKEGRLPENSGECLVASPNGYHGSFTLGETYSLSEENKNYEDLGDTFAQREFTSVGIVSTPIYMSVESEPSTTGDGTVDLILFVQDSAYSLEEYTDLFLTLKGAKEAGAFSEDYTRLVDDAEEGLKQLGLERSAIRLESVRGDAQKELDDAQREYDDKKREADEKLNDAWQEITDGEQELEDGRKELEEKKAELADGKQALEDGRKELEEKKAELADGRQKLEDAQAQLDSSLAESRLEVENSLDSLTQEQMDSLSAQIDQAEKEGSAEIEENRKNLELLRQGIASAEPELQEKEAELEEGWKQLEAGKAELEPQKQAYEQGVAALKSGREQFAQYIEASRAQLEVDRPGMTEEAYQAAKDAIDGEEAAKNQEFDQQEAALQETGEKLSAAEEKLGATEQALLQGQLDLEEGKAQLESLRQQYAEGTERLASAETELRDAISRKREELEASRGQIRDQVYAAAMAQIESAGSEAQAQIDASRVELEDGQAQIADAEAQLSDAQGELEDGEKQLADGEKELQDAKQELEDGKKEYQEQKQEAEEKLADGQREIDDAQKKIDDLEEPEWVILDRRDNVSYSGYKSNSEKVAAIAQVFPVFFFLVAALVALTTMTRMVEEERTQIGTLKALGYKNGSILFYYVFYSLAASLVGGVIGILLGFYSLPLVIANAYSMLYTLPPTVMVFYWEYALVIIPLAVLCTMAATLFACAEQLREKPSSLMQMRAPKAGKRILLERVGFLWKKLTFTHKVTARNIFRYKKRFYMTVFGIAGCCALLVTGFGVRDSIRDIVGKQFGEIYSYNLQVALKSEDAEKTDPQVAELMGDPETVERYARVHSESGKVSRKDLSIYAYEDREAFLDQINLRDRRSGEPLEVAEDTVILTEKLCEQLSLKVGDTFTLEDSDGRRAEFTLGGIAENYISGYAFLSAETFERAFHKAPQFKTLLVTTASGEEEFRARVSEQLLKSDEVSYISFMDAIRESFTNTVKNIDYIVIVLIVCAGGLAVIVLYNLTNINICERKKELATIKVLGFHGKEVASYIYRETFILCLIGIVVGFFLGIALHAFVIQTAEVDMVMFGRQIYPMSYVLAAGVTLLFTGLVDLIMLKKLRKIDMVESMKANE